MRLMVFFDLPVDTSKDRKNYRIFRKYLIKNGFIMQQYSLYTKLLINENEIKSEINKLKINKPPLGVVQVLTITEKQYANIIYVTGEKTKDSYVDNTENLVVIC